MATNTIFIHASETGGAATTDSAVSLGVVFTASETGSITHISFWKTASDTTTSRSVGLYSGDGAGETLIASGTSSSEPTGIAQWIDVALTTPYTVTALMKYTAAVHYPNGEYPASSGYFTTSAKVHGNLTAVKSSDSTYGNGRYNYGASISYPAFSFGDSNYWIDVTLSTGSTAIVGSLDKTLGAVTSSSTGAVALAGSLSQSIGNLTLSSAGALPIVGTVSSTIAAITLSAVGTSSAPETPAINPTGIGAVVDTRKRDRQDKEAQDKRDEWEGARIEAVERAFERVFGEKVAPVEITEPKQKEIIRAARFDLQTDGIEARLSTLSAILDKLIAEARRDMEDDDAIMLLLMAA